MFRIPKEQYPTVLSLVKSTQKYNMIKKQYNHKLIGYGVHNKHEWSNYCHTFQYDLRSYKFE